MLSDCVEESQQVAKEGGKHFNPEWRKKDIYIYIYVESIEVINHSPIHHVYVNTD